jgi:hypothetical protein
MNVESKRIKHSFIVGNKLLNYMEQGQNKRKEQQENGVDNADAYISQMSPFELSAYRIAKSHLGTSFNLKKSNGFLKWISARR